jgi:hypothetical protein
MQSSEVSGQTLPVARFIFNGPKRLKDEEVLEVGENVGGSNTPSGTECGKTRGFDPEKAAWYICHCLGHEMRTVGVAQQPSLCNGASGKSSYLQESTCSADRSQTSLDGDTCVLVGAAYGLIRKARRR